MKKFIFSLMAVLAMATSARAVVIAGYSFTGTTDNSASPATGLQTVGAISLVGASLDSTVGSGSPSGSAIFGSLQTGASDYVQFTVNAAANYNLKNLSLTFATAASASPGTFYTVSYNINGVGFASLASNTSITGTSTSFGNSPAYLISGANITSLVVRINFGKNTGSGNPNAWVDNIALESDVTPVPEPTNIALILFGVTFAGVGVSRKFLKKKA